jgi:hypothetical protein
METRLSCLLRQRSRCRQGDMIHQTNKGENADGVV